MKKRTKKLLDFFALRGLLIVQPHGLSLGFQMALRHMDVRNAALLFLLTGMLDACTSTAPMASAPEQSPLPGARRVSAAMAPEYPAAYRRHPRAGQVAVHCDIRPDRTLGSCKLLAVSGGDAFGQSVMTMLSVPGRPATTAALNDPDPGHRLMLFTFLAPGMAWPNPVPIAGGQATPPPGVTKTAYRNVLADCRVDEAGVPSGCRIVAQDQSSLVARAALAWLSNGDVRLAPYPRELIGDRRIVEVPFSTR